jgi:hypothetical protein
MNSKHVKLSLLSLLAVALFASPSFGQTALTQTTLASAIADSSSTFVSVASATGIVANSTILFVDQEAMFVNSISGTIAGVTRGHSGTRANPHASGSVVWVGSPSQFTVFDPSGSCTAANTVAPYIAMGTGLYWRCDSATGVWQNFFTTGSITPAATSAAIQTASQNFTVNGLLSGEPIFVVSQPAPTSLCPLVGARVTAANTVTLYWTVLTAAACTPAAGSYNFMVPRLHAK